MIKCTTEWLSTPPSDAVWFTENGLNMGSLQRNVAPDNLDEIYHKMSFP